MEGQRGSQIDRELYRQLHRELRKEELERERIMNSENVSKENYCREVQGSSNPF